MVAPSKTLKVHHFMTATPVVADPDDGCLYTFKRMRRFGIRHLPVVNEAGQLIGMVTDRDLRRPDYMEEADFPLLYILEDSTQVCDVMTSPVRVVRIDDDIRVAVDLFVKHRYGAIPVVDNEGSLDGILAAADLLRAIPALMKMAA